MSQVNLIAKAHTTIEASVDEVWNALVSPEMIKQYMFGATVASDWKKGTKITWTGEIHGKKYEDKGEILEIVPGKKLVYSHFSPLSGAADKTENYHKVTITLEKEKNKTGIKLSQDKNGSEKEKSEAEKNWSSMLEGLKNLLEK